MTIGPAEISLVMNTKFTSSLIILEAISNNGQNHVTSLPQLFLGIVVKKKKDNIHYLANNHYLVICIAVDIKSFFIDMHVLIALSAAATPFSALGHV